MEIGILNYSVGNFGSLLSAIQKTGLFAKIAKTPEEIRSKDLLILPGVGHYSFCVNNLKTCGLDLAVKKHFNDKKPIIGICIGMQLCFEKSEEANYLHGLALVPGEVKKVNPDLRVPITGFRPVEFSKTSFLSKFNNEKFYFNHSFHCIPKTSKTIIGNITEVEKPNTVASVLDENFLGFQFHPEISGVNGIKLLKKALSEKWWK